MAGDGNQDVERIFAAVVAMPEADRAAYLAVECGDDAALRGEIEMLLQSDEDVTAGFLSAPVVWTDDDAGEFVEGAVLGGKYKLLRVLGEGGLGQVWLAEQVRPMRREVAVKVLKLGMDTKQVLARFEAERNALTIMDHPGIAHVYDAGTTERGRPFFAMEHVAGVPLTTFCDREQLTTAERLGLFVEICASVQHAHQKGVIHRDLKPSNILVALKDGEPASKVIDFGIAKATSQKLTERTVYTEAGQLIGTPEYMSPEQAEMSGLGVDTTTDIYSLGVVLYEMLTGVLPFDPRRRHGEGLNDICRAIREEEPATPSTRLSTLGDTDAIAKHRRTDSRTLRRQLRGDLDWIVMKAMEKQRSRRYQTVNGLAMDVRRHLDHEPVLAGPPSGVYRVRKFMRRHRVGLAAGTLVAVTLVAGIIGTSWQAVRANDALADSRRENAIARAINEFLTDDLLAAVAPSAQRGKGRDVLMREVLDEAAKRIEEAASADGRFADTPLVEAAIRMTLGSTYTALEAFDAAEPHLARAVELRTETLGVDDPDTLTSEFAIAFLHRRVGRYDEAAERSERVLALRREVLGPAHPDTLSSWRFVALAFIDRGRMSEAEQMLLELMEMQRREVPDDDRSRLNTGKMLGVVYRDQGRREEAEPLLLAVYEDSTRRFGPDAPVTLNDALAVGILYANYNDTLEKAEPMLLDMIPRMKRVLGEDYGQTLIAETVLSQVYRFQGRYDEAEPIERATLAAYRRTRGENDHYALQSMIGLGELLILTDRADEAAELLEEAKAGALETLGAEHFVTSQILLEYADALIRLGRYREAETNLLDAYRILSANLVPDHEYTITCIELLIEQYELRGETERAAEWRAKLPPRDDATSAGPGRVGD